MVEIIYVIRMGSKETLLRTKPLCILLQLKDVSKEWYASNLAAGCSTTYVHTTKLLREFKKSNLVTFEVKGRVKKVKLTDKGLQLTSALSDLVQKFEEGEEEKKQLQK
jgi:predicted transcriptional regulator